MATTDSAENVVEAIRDCVIKDGGLTEDGFHLELEDGRFLIFQGQFIIGLCRVDSTRLQ